MGVHILKKPNGWGSVYCMRDKTRRNPWRVTKTIKDTETGKRKVITLGYCRTKKEGLDLLSKYNYNPYDLTRNNMTFSQVYEQWKESHFSNITKRTQTMYNSFYRYFEPIKDTPIRDLNLLQLQNLFNNFTVSSSSKKLIKTMLNLIYKYALKYEIITKDYSVLVEIGKNEKILERKIFTSEEIQKLWDNLNIIWVDTILIMIYTGLRIGELLEIKNINIDLENRTIKGGIKTDAGKDRIIPINYKILSLIKNRMRASNEYLIVGKREKKLNYSNYREFFIKTMEILELSHTIHDCRHTFATLLSNANANRESIAKIIGHSSYNTTEKIYTHKDIEELKKAIDLI